MRREPARERPLSKVEVTGFEARHYDLLMDLFSGGTYPSFIRRVVRDMEIRPRDAILDLGSGTGRNACLMDRRLSGEGRILGLDIGREMLDQARRRCRARSRVSFEKRRVEEPLPFEEEFDKVFLSFVLHGFVQEDRLRILANARRALRPGGELLVLDYSECEPTRSSWPIRLLFRLECPLATDFVRRDWRRILAAEGFGTFRIRHYYLGHVRLLGARRKQPFSPGVRAAATCLYY